MLWSEETNHNYQKYFSLIEKEEDRGAVLVAAAAIDDILQELLEKTFSNPSSKKNDLFSGANAPLSSFSAKIELCYRLGIINLKTRNTFNVFRKMRNEFAHSYDNISFQTPKIRDYLIEIFENQKLFISEMSKYFASALNSIMSEESAKWAVEHVEPRNMFDNLFALNLTLLKDMKRGLKPAEIR